MLLIIIVLILLFGGFAAATMATGAVTMAGEGLASSASLF